MRQRNYTGGQSPVTDFLIKVLKQYFKLDVVIHIYNPRTQEAKVGRLLQVQGQPGIQSDNLSPKNPWNKCL